MASVSLTRLATLLAIGAIILQSALPLVAQSEFAGQVTLNSTLITDDFPSMTIKTPCSPDVTPNGAHSFTVVENDKLQKTSLNIENLQPKRQVAILVDLFVKSQDPAVWASEVYTRVVKLESLSIAHLIDPSTTQFAVFKPGSEPGGLQPILIDDTAVWAQKRPGNLGKTRSEVNRIRKDPETLPAQVPTRLLTLLQKTMDTFDGDAAVQKEVVLFSDGSHPANDLTATEVISQATAKGIKIHTIFMPTLRKPDPVLEQLANGTNGLYVNDWSIDKIEEFWKSLFAIQTLCKVSWRSQNLQPVTITINDVLNNKTIQSQNLQPKVFTIHPPTVAILSPKPSDTLLLAVNGTTQPQPLLLEVKWDLNGFPGRKIKKITYDIRGADNLIGELTVTEEKKINQRIPIAGLSPGSYLIEVHAYDELGLIGTQAVPFAITLPTVVPPTPTIMPTSQPRLLSQPRVELVTLSSSATLSETTALSPINGLKISWDLSEFQAEKIEKVGYHLRGPTARDGELPLPASGLLSYTLPISDLLAGSYQVELQAIATSGVLASPTIPILIQAPPEPPVFKPEWLNWILQRLSSPLLFYSSLFFMLLSLLLAARLLWLAWKRRTQKARPRTGGATGWSQSPSPSPSPQMHLTTAILFRYELEPSAPLPLRSIVRLSQLNEIPQVLFKATSDMNKDEKLTRCRAFILEQNDNYRIAIHKDSQMAIGIQRQQGKTLTLERNSPEFELEHLDIIILGDTYYRFHKTDK